MPACGSPWLFAAYHVFLRRPVPWHPPCALCNLIVTKLSSCQSLYFDSLFLRPTAKLFSQLVSYKMFSIWLCSFQGAGGGGWTDREKRSGRRGLAVERGAAKWPDLGYGIRLAVICPAGHPAEAACGDRRGLVAQAWEVRTK